MNKFELVSAFAGQEDLLPRRATMYSAGYDFFVAETTTIPSFRYFPDEFLIDSTESMTIEAFMQLTKKTGFKPTLIPTGVKCYLDPDKYLQLSLRSSIPLKTWLILANGVGIIDSDYVDNPSNEGHIYFQVINLSPYDLVIPRGEKIGQGIILPYDRTINDPVDSIERTGGFGSTSEPQRGQRRHTGILEEASAVI